MRIIRYSELRPCAVVDGDAQPTAEILLEADEQVTFCTPDGGQYDVAMKDWGLYATPSVGGRLPRFRMRAVLVRAETGVHLMLVEAGRERDFEAEMKSVGIRIQSWLDNGVGALAKAGKT
jgi:hypothetical protein